jgi:putative ABC transport system permease protein
MTLWDWMFRRRQREEELDDEVQSHLRMARQERMEQGETSEQARASAVREFGNVTLVKETTRDMWGFRWLEELLQDFRYGVRQLGRNPGFTVVAILTLALGIGANTAIFSVVNSVLLQPLPMRDGHRVVVIWVNNLTQGWSRMGPSGQDYLDWREQSTAFEDLFLFEHGSGTVTGLGEPEQVAGLRVTTNFGAFFGIKPILGRTFRLDEARGRHNLIILSSGYWQRHFGSEPTVLGKAITLNGESYTVIGVLPPGLINTVFHADVVVPFDNDWVKRADSDLGVFGRLKPGITLRQASAEMGVIAERIGRQRASRKGFGAVLVPVEEVRVEYIRPALLVLLGAVGFVLLVACTNVANLLLARAVGRHREVAVRMALGAGRMRLLGQFLVESTVLALLGGAVGFLLAQGGTDLLMRLVPSSIPVPNAADVAVLPKVHMDGRVVIFTALASLLAGIIFGLAPAFQSLRCNVNESLKEGGRGFLTGVRGHRTLSTLLVTEAALAFVLVIGAGLMIKSFWRLLGANPGFRTDHLLTLRIKLSADRQDSAYREPRKRALALRRFLESTQALPGVQSAALTEIVPLSQESQDRWFFVIKEAAPLPPGQKIAADLRDVSPSYFTTMGIPLLGGRVFSEYDNADAPPVVMIDETLAHQFFPNQDPLGKHLQLPDATKPAREIVGVVGAVRETGVDQQPLPTIYFPYLQSPDQTVSLVVRTASEPRAILPALKNAIWSVDKDQPLFNIKTMDEIISADVSAQRLAFILLGILAFLALTLAAIGIYGVTSYAISQRTREIGIRMALGAERYDVFSLVIRYGLKLTMLGVAVGAVAAVVLTRFLGSLLYGVKSTDPMTYLVVSLILTAVALAASYIPARRAAKVDPTVALRYE